MQDVLEQAKRSLGASFGDYSQELNAQRAQAAALIAQVETDQKRNEYLAIIAEQAKRIADVLEGGFDLGLHITEGGQIEVIMDTR